MFVLGIDPGLALCGYACVQQSGKKLEPVTSGVIKTASSQPLPARLATLSHDFHELLEELSPDAVAVERVLFQVNTSSAMSVAQAGGIVMAAAAKLGCEVEQYSPNQVKSAVAGYAKAHKDEVATMVKIQLNLKQIPAPADVADAYAVALCHLALADGLGA